MADIIHLTEVHGNKKGSHQAKSGGTITMEDGRVLPISKKERQKL